MSLSSTSPNSSSTASLLIYLFLLYRTDPYHSAVASVLLKVRKLLQCIAVIESFAAMADILWNQVDVVRPHFRYVPAPAASVNCFLSPLHLKEEKYYKIRAA